MWKGEMVVSPSIAVHHITTKFNTKNDEYVLHLSVFRFAGSQRIHLKMSTKSDGAIDSGAERARMVIKRYWESE